VGCCCGHAQREGPKTPPGTLKREMRRTFRQAELEERVRLAFSDCLGPCSEAKVVDGGGRGLPPVLAERAFAWTGGGDGPEPPIDEGT